MDVQVLPRMDVAVPAYHGVRNFNENDCPIEPRPGIMAR